MILSLKAIPILQWWQPINPIIRAGTGYEFKFIFVKGLDHTYQMEKSLLRCSQDSLELDEKYVLEDSTSNEGQKIKVVTEVQDTNREYFLHIYLQLQQ